MTLLNLAPLPPGSQGSPSWTGCGFDAASLEQHQVGRAVTAGHAGLEARADLVPVVAGFGAAWPAGVVYSIVFTLGGHTNGVRPPKDGDSLPLTGSAVSDEGLTVAVFMDRALTHVSHT